MAIDLSKFINRFVEEARENLNRISEGLSALDQGERNPDIINSIFRAAHTIKGSSRMLKLNSITDVAHHLEDVLSALRDTGLNYTPAMSPVLYQGVDAIASLVDTLDASKNTTSLPPADASICQALTALIAPNAANNSTPELPIPAATTTAIEAIAAPSPTLTPAVVTTSTTPDLAKDDSAKLKTVDTIRIKRTKLDELLALMGELISSHSNLLQRVQDSRQLELTAQAAHLSNTVLIQPLHEHHKQLKNTVLDQEAQMHELLDKALALRMLPLSIVFEPASRMVREFAHSIGKQTRALVTGAEIELDRHLIDKLADPFVHIIRNAIDHGIEPPEKRVALGKPISGKISLSAQQDGAWVLIEISDDGAGISLKNVTEKAIRKGLTTREKAIGLADQEIIDFIFLPGFSTADIITEVSGRGVGMDVVKKVIVEELHGTIMVDTKEGQGSRFRLRLPMSLALSRILLIELNNITYGITAQYVAELLQVERHSLITVAERQVIIVRNEFVPIVALAELLTPHHTQPTLSPMQATQLLLVVLQVGSEKIAISVDALRDERDMIIKPLPKHLQYIKHVSGMVVTGNNALVNVLHAPALINLTRRAKSQRKKQPSQDHMVDEAAAIQTWHILVVDDSLNTREIEKDILEAHGYLVTLAEDGLDGLNKAREGDFDAILTDVEMPNMDGFTLTSHLRQEERYQHRPIIIITSREKEEDKRRGIQVGADAYIVKGDFDQSSLVDTLNALLA